MKCFLHREFCLFRIMVPILFCCDFFCSQVTLNFGHFRNLRLPKIDRAQIGLTPCQRGCFEVTARRRDKNRNMANRPRSICFAAQGGNYTKSRPGGRRVELWRQPRVSLILFFLVTFQYFVSEMVLTCTVSIYIICKYGNGEIFTHSEEENGSRHL